MSNITHHPASIKARTYATTDRDGNPVVGNTLSQRVDDFRRKFPLSEGWAVKIDHQFTDILFSTVDQKELVTVLFTATLLHHGEVRETASSLVPIEGNKSWEGGESNARSRLLEVVGCGRFDLDDDDEFHRRQTERILGPHQATFTPETVKPEQPVATSTAAEPTQVSLDEPSRNGSAASTATKSAVPKTFLTQIQRKCQLLGKKVPDFASNEEAKAFWVSLNEPPGEARAS